VQVPYSRAEGSVESIDYDAGADAILRSIADGSYETMLRHHFDQARKFNNVYAAHSFASFFQSPATADGVR
jgi:hypothetical protein